MIIPGFIDAHVHPTIAGIQHFQCDLTIADTLEEAKMILQQLSSTLAKGEWLVGGGWKNEWFPPTVIVFYY